MDEDYPGQKREIEINDAIKCAVNDACGRIIEASDGSVEETDYLTMRVAEEFVNKVNSRISMRYLKYQLEQRQPAPPRLLNEGFHLIDELTLKNMVRLLLSMDRKIDAIKFVRHIKQWDLPKAKEYCEALPPWGAP